MGNKYLWATEDQVILDLVFHMCMREKTKSKNISSSEVPLNPLLTKPDVSALSIYLLASTKIVTHKVLEPWQTKPSDTAVF